MEGITYLRANDLSKEVSTEPYDWEETVRNKVPPKFPQFQTDAQRLNSYQSADHEWPARLITRVSELVDSGFFYTGNEDSVRCFQCGIGLRNWDPQDSAWIEHARWFPRCGYLLEKKGKVYVEKVQDASMRANMDDALQENNIKNHLIPDFPVDDPSSSIPKPQNRQLLALTKLPKDAPKPSEFEKRNPLIHPAAQALLEHGYLPKIIKQVVDFALKTYGWDYMSGSNLMKIVMDMEENNRIDPILSLMPSKRPGKSTLQKMVESYDKSKCNIEKLKAEIESMKESRVCQFCSEAEITIAFLPCGHLVSCAQCSPAMKFCPICRSVVKATVKVQMN